MSLPTPHPSSPPTSLILNDSGYIIISLSPSLSPSLLTPIISSITHLHTSCILTDHTLATFLPPLSCPEMLTWWETRLSNPTITTWIILAPLTSRTTGNSTTPTFESLAFSSIPYPTIPTTSGEATEVAAVVSLISPPSQTGPFRATVEKLFVSPFHRRRGFARLILSALEDWAWERDRWLLMLDTEVGSEAEMVYPRLGWERGMVVRRYGISPRDGREVDEVWFWKDLRWERGEKMVGG